MKFAYRIAYILGCLALSSSIANSGTITPLISIGCVTICFVILLRINIKEYKEYLYNETITKN